MNTTKNPLELEENHFEQQQHGKEDEFKSEFEIPTAGNIGFLDEDPGSNGAAEEGDDDDDKRDFDFKFDDTLAEEERKELEELNKKLGTNFEKLADLRQSIQQSDQKDQKNTIEQTRQLVNYFKAVLDYDAEKIIREDKMMAAEQKGLDLNSEDVKDQIEMEIEQMKDSGVLSYVADSIKNNVRMALEKNQKVVDDYDNGLRLTKEQEEKAFKSKIEEGINAIYKEGNFLGIKPTKEDLINVYRDVSKNKHIDHLKANPTDAVEFALFLKYKSEIQKKLGKPDFKAGVKSVLNEIGMTGSQPGSNANVNSNSSSDDELSYFQKLAK